jgi:hypothetical protein
MNCDPAFGSDPQLCYAVQRYGRFFVSEFGRMKKPTIAQLQAEIWQRGPISCSVDAGALEYGKYDPGTVLNISLFMQNKQSWEPDHDVSVVGWNRDENGMYWIVRNSWGSYWGDQGWFYVRAGFNSMGIEDVCNWAVIDPDPRFEDWGPRDGEHVFASAPDPPTVTATSAAVTRIASQPAAPPAAEPPAAEPAVADLPAILTLHRQDSTSKIVELEKLDEYQFHKSIVDYLTTGAPMSVTALQSRNVVAIMQAAEESARNNAMPVSPSLRLVSAANSGASASARSSSEVSR